MKVKIGRYNRHWDTRRIEDFWYRKRYNKSSYDLSSIDMDIYDKVFKSIISFWWFVIIRPANRFFSSQKRNIKIRIDNYDVWSADHTLALIIHPVLLNLRENKMGAPFVDDEDVPEYLRSTNAEPKVNEWDTDSLWHKRWEWVLDEMIWAFDQIANNEEGDDQFYTGEAEYLFQGLDINHNKIGEPIKFDDKKTKKDSNIVLWEMVPGPNHTLVCDDDGITNYSTRITNGTKLFGKYYRGLWD